MVVALSPMAFSSRKCLSHIIIDHVVRNDQSTITGELPDKSKVMFAHIILGCQVKAYVIEVDTVAGAKEYLSQNMEYFDNKGYFILVLEDSRANIDILLADTILEPFENLLVLATNEQSSTIDLWTHQYFVDGQRTAAQFLGSYTHGTLVWSFADAATTFFPAKMTSFGRHRFKASAFHYPPKVSRDGDEWDGVEIRLLRAVADTLDFR